VKRTAPDDPWLTTKEVAKRYGRSLRTLKGWDKGWDPPDIIKQGKVS
jgi:transposase